MVVVTNITSRMGMKGNNRFTKCENTRFGNSIGMYIIGMVVFESAKQYQVVTSNFIACQNF